MVVAVGGWAWTKRNANVAEAADTIAEAQTAANVIIQPARQMPFERALTIQGNVEAKHFAVVSPRIDGAITEIFVDEGDYVDADETKLFQTDPVKLGKTLEVRQHEVDVAEHSLQEKRASLVKYQADFDKAEYDWKRYLDLYERDASSADELETAETTYRGSRALLDHATALVALAEAQLEQARSAQAIAEKDLADSLIVAPITGHITARYQEPGEMGKIGEPVLRIEDLTLVEVSVFVPARAYGEVVVGQTNMRIEVNGVDLGEHPVSYKSPTIDSQLRTFEARCLLQDPPPAVAPGAMARVQVILERHEGLGVPRDAIQIRGGKTVVFVADNGKARMVPAKVGLEAEGMVEVTSDELAEGADVVAVGGYFLDPDDAIQVVQENG